MAAATAAAQVPAPAAPADEASAFDALTGGAPDAPAAGAVVAVTDDADTEAPDTDEPQAELPLTTDPDELAAVRGLGVVIVSFGHPRPRRVASLARRLHAIGVDVHLLSVAREEAWRRIDLPAGVPVHSVARAEARRPLLFTEQLLVHRAPRTVLVAIRRLAPGRPLKQAVGVVQRAHSAAAGTFHRRVFDPVYRYLRPSVLSRAARTVAARSPLPTAPALVIAADPSAIPYVWHLTRTTAVPTQTHLDHTTTLAALLDARASTAANA